ncbi:enoyl-CoA hydratase [Rothia sp. ZJ932]|uniref:enoyl-CoA hydratase n=1 Tax=Rothia sp. ZJ932 TaxID=2810516 RepID=UPI00196857D5|nr:enoyl-CoA hydratase [Rothia sp. ZJ932]QRZ61687.1 enoyl-CoA hydratase [Rothia sp. ZJ932]
MYENILVETRGRVGVITLNRPKSLNALNEASMREVVAAAREFDSSTEIGAIVLAGSEKAFAAGADIKEMAPQSATQMFAADWFAHWEGLTSVRTPVVAAVRGYALGGGCELAMMADVLVASEDTTFGQPEINLGIMPGMGGSQRLTRAVGKAKAMDMILTGRMIGGSEAERIGLVSRLVEDEQVLSTALEVAETIAGKSKHASQVAKEAVNTAFETTLAQGLLFERRAFHALFASEDQKEGMAAFVEKREADFKHR